MSGRSSPIPVFEARRFSCFRSAALSHPSVLALADRTGLMVNDANYLWLAGLPGAELVTLDVKPGQAHAKGP
jgi:hypothetical protein